MQNKGFVKVFCGITHAGMRVLSLFSFVTRHYTNKAKRNCERRPESRTRLPRLSPMRKSGWVTGR